MTIVLSVKSIKDWVGLIVGTIVVVSLVKGKSTDV